MNSRQGATLLETLFAMFLVIFVVMILLQLIPSALIATRASECEVQAHAMAERCLEQQRTQDFQKLQPGQHPLPDWSQDGMTFHGEYTVWQPANSNPDYARGLKVHIWWDFQGQRKEITRQTVICDVKN